MINFFLSGLTIFGLKNYEGGLIEFIFFPPDLEKIGTPGNAKNKGSTVYREGYSGFV